MVVPGSEQAFALLQTSEMLKREIKVMEDRNNNIRYVMNDFLNKGVDKELLDKVFKATEEIRKNMEDIKSIAGEMEKIYHYMSEPTVYGPPANSLDDISELIRNVLS